MRPKIITISGTSGAGKSFLVDKIMLEFPGITEIAGVTTRPMRQGEIQGQSSHFITNDIYNLLIVEVVKKEIKLKNKKNQIFYNKIKYFESIDEILKIMSKRDREKFIEYLNQKGNVKKSMS